ncbi:MAG: (d)CMP kinase [Magnetococcales bacterium]|nr:(d)CMP kinase [Magnetococcales bacterium]
MSEQQPEQIAKGSRYVVAVDGPAGAGKGAICRAVAARFGFSYLDTGSIYRGVALLSLQNGVSDEEELGEVAANMPFEFRAVADGGFRAFLAGNDVSATLREERVGRQASHVAAVPQVRAALLTFQRRYGGDNNIILDGRDTGTVVWPDADLKVFLTASLEERAKRRALELQGKGETVSFHKIRDMMAERDARDESRTHAPLASAKDAHFIDTTLLTLEQSIDSVVKLVDKLVGNRPR